MKKLSKLFFVMLIVLASIVIETTIFAESINFNAVSVPDILLSSEEVSDDSEKIITENELKKVLTEALEAMSQKKTGDEKELAEYLNAIKWAFTLIKDYFNTTLTPAELARERFEKAIKTLVSIDQHSKGFNPQEAQLFNDDLKPTICGIGASVDQSENWTLQKTEEIPIHESRTELLSRPTNSVISIMLEGPNGEFMGNLNQDIPVGAKLTIQTKHPQKPNYVLMTTSVRERKSVEIIEIFSGGGAEKAGLQAKDIILEVDGKPTIDFPFIDNICRIRGPAGTKVNLLIQRNEQKFNAEITRAEINKIEAEVKTEKYGDIGYIQLKKFNEGAANLVKQILDEFTDNNIGKLVLDLRNNPGGLLDEALKELECFIEDGQILIGVRSRGEAITPQLSYSSRASVFKGKIIVLVNNQSASASEIIAGGLQQHGLASVAGEKSFGKGSVQNIFSLPKNDAVASIKLTIQEWLIFNPFTKEYVKVDGVGINPDIQIDPNLSIEEILKNPNIMTYFNN